MEAAARRNLARRAFYLLNDGSIRGNGFPDCDAVSLELGGGARFSWLVWEAISRSIYDRIIVHFL